jgi:hypothetical protein
MSPERRPINVVSRGEHNGGQISVTDAVIDTVVEAGVNDALLGAPLHHDLEAVSREGRAGVVFATCSPKASLRPPGAQPTSGSKGNTGRTVAQGARASP